jgi:hypothetical protein
MTVPFSQITELKDFFRIIEGNNEEEEIKELVCLRSLVKDWSVSHATLEEVFMKVTRKCD